MARKKHLLEVLREREHRAAGGGESSKRPPTAVRQPMDLPPMLFPFLGGALILALLVWAGMSFFGGGGTTNSPESNAESTVTLAGDSVLAVTYDGSLREKAVEAARALVALGYNAKLAPSKAPSGEEQLKLFVVPADLSELESLLQEIRALPLLGQAAPFAGANLDTLPS
ncbi:MAG: hypothetical protein O3A95_09055 [Planctomycetota bacterium]|nr:hypothetical protein [Planctomycetota bacterium]MDA1114430.1 hypothetical protein [Planctomycetota bacterium]